jgi:tetratricopeptide (TPR) repeat protein
MTLWNKLFGKRKKERQSSPAQKPRPAPHQTGSPPKQVSPAATLAQTNPQQQMASMMWVVKKPRYAHMAKAHELRGEFSQANYNYAMLAEAQTQTLGESHPDLATVLYEMARLNQHHHAEIEQMPQMQMILNTLGPGSQINMYYQSALQMRLMALGDQHTAYAQSLYGLASFYKEAQKATEALPLLEQALTIQSTEADPLPTALTTLCLADVNRVNGDPTAAIDLYQNGLSLLDLSSESLRAIDEAESDTVVVQLGQRTSIKFGNRLRSIGARRTRLNSFA